MSNGIEVAKGKGEAHDATVLAKSYSSGDLAEAARLAAAREEAEFPALEVERLKEKVAKAEAALAGAKAALAEAQKKAGN